MLNPFFTLPPDACDIFPNPAIPVDQDCTDYAQLLSQISAIIVCPDGANKPTNWQNSAGWEGVIDNTDTTGTKCKYLTGIGGLTPAEGVQINLSGGRHIEYREKQYDMSFRILNRSATGHEIFADWWEVGWKGFSVWFETLGGRLVGGAEGMRPVVVQCFRPYGAGNTDKEYIQLDCSFFF